MSTKTEDEEEKARASIAQLLWHMRETWPLQLDIIGLKAKTCRARFVALRSEGFSIDEALKLCLEDVKL